jgi:hypothetical protein
MIKKRQVNFFPSGYPDESLFSLVSRYHQLSGNLDDRATLSELFGKHTLIVTSHLPSLIDVFIGNLPSGSKVGSQTIIDQYTVFPYYRPFLSERQHSQAMALMKGDTANGLKTMMGLVPSQTGSSGNCYRFCDRCKSYDVEQYGQPYWHRAHQLPMVWICHEHGVPLYELNSSWVSLNRHRLFLPTAVNVLEHAEKIDVEERHFSLLNDVAILSKELLDARHETICRRKLRATYLRMAKELDLANANGRLRIQELSACIKGKIFDLPDLVGFQFLRPNNFGAYDWATSLLRKARKSSHPLKHIFLMHSLNGDFDAFASVNDDVPKSRAPKPCDPPPPVQAMEQRLSKLIVEDKKSLRQCAQILKLSVTTLRIEATRLGIDVLTRPKILKENQLETLRQALLSTTSLKSIAQIHLVSVVSLYRILRMYPEVAQPREKLIFEMERSKRRANFIAGNKKLFARNLPDYAWLYRNDRDWLTHSIKSAPKKSLTSKPRIDWGRRDTKFVEDIQNYSKQLYDAPKPVHVTKAALGRKLNALSMLEKHLSKLPLTAIALDQAIETREQFQCRRLKWAAQHILIEQHSVPKWMLLRVAGLRPDISGPILSLANSLTR